MVQGCTLLSVVSGHSKIFREAEGHDAFRQAVYHAGVVGSESGVHNTVHNVVCVVQYFLILISSSNTVVP